jgi:hypothetical protein
MTAVSELDVSLERLAPLVERFGDRVKGAVDDLEVAVVLESGGINDHIARVEYGASDVFDLGVRLRATMRTAQRVAHPATSHPDWYGPLWLALPRGLAYVLAGVTSMMAVEATNVRGGAMVMIVANIVATGMMHSLSYLGHVALQRHEVAIAAGSLRPFLLGGVGLASASGVLLAVLFGWRIGVLAGTPLIYVMSIVVLLVLRRDRTVMTVMIPLGAVAVTYLLSDGTLPTAGYALGAAGAAVALLFVIAVHATRAVGGKRPPLRLGVIDARAVVPLALGGLAIAGFVGANVIALSDLNAMEDATAKQWFLLALPFFLTIVFAEFGVIALRRRLVRELSQGITVVEFARAARHATARMWLLHSTLGLIGIVLALLAVRLPAEPLMRLVIAVDFFFVGSVLLAALLLVSNDAERPLARSVPPVVGVLLVLRLLVPGPTSFNVAMVICLLGGALAAVLGVTSVTTTTELGAHR